MKKLLWTLCLLFFNMSHFFADGGTLLQIEGYEKGKTLPLWAKDLRRAEIIAFGSLPFSALSVTLAYSLYRYAANDFKAAYIPNPFPLSSTEAKLNTNEQIGIVTTAAVLSLAIGLTDFIVIKVKQNRKKKADRISGKTEGSIHIESVLPDCTQKGDTAPLEILPKPSNEKSFLPQNAPVGIAGQDFIPSAASGNTADISDTQNGSQN